MVLKIINHEKQAIFHLQQLISETLSHATGELY